MDRILLLTSTDLNLQTRRSVEHLRSGLGDRVAHLQITPGGWTRALGQIGKVRKASRTVGLLHAWGYDALKIATFASDVPLVYTPLASDPPRAARWLKAVSSRRAVRVISQSVGEDQWLVCSGIPTDNCHIVRPGVKMPRELTRDPVLRASLGVSEKHITILAVGESVACTNHLTALHAVAILHEMDPRYVMLLWGKGSGAGAVVQLHNAWKNGAMINACEIDPNMEYEDLIRAADLALVTAPSRLALSPVLACMAGNLPIVAPATREISEVLEDRHTAMLYSPLTPRVIGQRIMAAAEDAPTARKLADQARAEAYELFSISRYISQMRELYEHAAAASLGR